MTRVEAAIIQDFKVLLESSAPYALSSPSFGSTTLHDFVKGLILSTNLIDLIEKYIPEGNHVEWGQIIDLKGGNSLSKECDIVLYKANPFKRIANKSMRFVIVERAKTRMVIQVKSGIQSLSRDDKQYCRDVRKFAKEVWYFAENCYAGSKARAEKLRKSAKGAGYGEFFYLVRVNDRTGSRTMDDDQLLRFHKKLTAIE